MIELKKELIAPQLKYQDDIPHEEIRKITRDRMVEDVKQRKELLYEYYWERNYPYTPTTHALLTDRYKFIRYQGIWDLDEFYDMLEDPDETRNNTYYIVNGSP